MTWTLLAASDTGDDIQLAIDDVVCFDGETLTASSPDGITYTGLHCLAKGDAYAARCTVGHTTLGGARKILAKLGCTAPVCLWRHSSSSAPLPAPVAAPKVTSSWSTIPSYYSVPSFTTIHPGATVTIAAPPKAAPGVWTQIVGLDEQCQVGDSMMYGHHTTPQEGEKVQGWKGKTLQALLLEGVKSLWRKVSTIKGDWYQIVDLGEALRKGDLVMYSGCDDPTQWSADSGLGYVVGGIAGTAWSKVYTKGRTCWRKVSAGAAVSSKPDWVSPGGWVRVMEGSLQLGYKRLRPGQTDPDTEGDLVNHEWQFSNSVSAYIGAGHSIWRRSGPRQLPGNRHFGRPLPLP